MYTTVGNQERGDDSDYILRNVVLILRKKLNQGFKAGKLAGKVYMCVNTCFQNRESLVNHLIEYQTLYHLISCTLTLENFYQYDILHIIL